MAFVVEDGVGDADANSYCSVPAADAYHAARLNVEWAKLEQEIKEAALVKATDWIENNYGFQFVSLPMTAVQALSWPRSGLIDPATGYEFPRPYMPRKLVEATAALALDAAMGELYNRASPAAPQLVEKTVGPITKKYNPLNPAQMTASRNFDYVRQMLSGLVQGKGLTLRTVRA